MVTRTMPTSYIYNVTNEENGNVVVVEKLEKNHELKKKEIKALEDAYQPTFAGKVTVYLAKVEYTKYGMEDADFISHATKIED